MGTCSGSLGESQGRKEPLGQNQNIWSEMFGQGEDGGCLNLEPLLA